MDRILVAWAVEMPDFKGGYFVVCNPTLRKTSVLIDLEKLVQKENNTKVTSIAKLTIM